MEDARILIVEDDPDVGKAMKLVLNHGGAEVFVSMNGRDALRTLYAEQPDLVILDLMLPDMNGWEVLERIRELSNVPIVIVTAQTDENLELRGLALGAVDYVRKPFSSRILLARVDAALRCVIPVSTKVTQADYQDDYLFIDLERHRVLLDGKQIRLSALEHRILKVLVENAGHVLSKEQILNRVWGTGYEESHNSVRLHISNLRRKLEQDPRNPCYIVTEYGIGYRFEKREN